MKKARFFNFQTIKSIIGERRKEWVVALRDGVSIIVN